MEVDDSNRVGENVLVIPSDNDGENEDSITMATTDADEYQAVNQEQGEPYCISLSSSSNSSNQSSFSKESAENEVKSAYSTDRLDFSNLDFSMTGLESRDSSVFNASACASHNHSTAASSENEESLGNEQNFSVSEINISETDWPVLKNIEIRTVPEDEDLFNMDDFPSTPADQSYHQNEFNSSSALVSINATHYESDHSDSEASISSSSSGSYETDTSDDDQFVNEDLATLARGTYPVKRAPGRPKSTIPSTSTKKAQPSKDIWPSRLQERLEKSKQVTDRWLKDLEVPESLSFNVPVNIPIVELNQYLTCGLCFGYLYEASTITECMHTFCKNCIVRHCMEISLHCPTCSVLIHPTDPFVNIRLDRMIQDIVDKLLPQVPEEEIRRIKEFYDAHPDVEAKEIKSVMLVKPKVKTTPKRHVTPKVHIPDPLISVLLEHEGDDGNFREPLERKYLRVTGSATVNSVYSYLRKHLQLQEGITIDIFCCGDTIEEEDCTLLSIREKFYSEDDCLMLLQYKIRDT